MKHLILITGKPATGKSRLSNRMFLKESVLDEYRRNNEIGEDIKVVICQDIREIPSDIRLKIKFIIECDKRTAFFGMFGQRVFFENRYFKIDKDYKKVELIANENNFIEYVNENSYE